MGTNASPASWSTGLLDCFSDAGSCCLVFWCPCVAFGRIAEVVNRGATSCCCSGTLYLLLCTMSCPWMLSCVNRGKLKARSNIPASCCEDCCTHFWCECCAICQEYRELQIQGFDLSLGWEGNEKTAPVAPNMNR